MNNQGFRLFLMTFWLLPVTDVIADGFRPALLLIKEAAPRLVFDHMEKPAG
jgi:hypothetical protein